MKLKNNNLYSDDSIKVLEGLAAVRKRPGMYIGSTNQDGLHHLIWEIFDNSIDEVIAGYADTILIQLFPDHSVMIQDNGRGIPVGINQTTKLSTVDTVFTTLHAGGKFGNNAYQVSGGLHGVGSSVVNALSEFLYVEVARDQVLYQSHFKHGGKIVQPLKKIGKTNKQGTKVYFKPDPSIFLICEFKSSMIIERLRETSFLFKNLVIRFTDLNNQTHVFNANEGLAGYVKFMNENKKAITPVCVLAGLEDKIDVQIAWQYTDEINDSIVAFANSVKNKYGGSHEQGFKQALSEAINDYAKKNKLLKSKNDLETSDVLEGIAAVIAVKIPENLIVYEGQTKTKLFTPEAKTAVYKVVLSQISKWLKDHKIAAEAIIKKAILSQESRLAARKAREEIRKIKTAKNSRMLAGKLTPAQSKKASENEIFLVEGDSAGGSAKNCRSKYNQAILPLKGKIINVEKSKLIDLLNNEEITAIINALGIGFGKDVNLKNLNYGKIIIMTDADNDGAHIQSLLLTLFYRYMKPLIENHHVYLANPPLYMVTTTKSKKPFYVWTNHEIKQLKKQYEKIEIKRFKGLGEMQPEQLWETTMNPKTRQLIAITMDNISLVERRIMTLMGNDVTIRKTWINENINFIVEDDLYEQ
ncbi:DNA gyrase subunit B [[Mycoplasma] cavipharyngis]|uniref:DNA gyrase/topoisomerase IV subunit B n=1 Tax=[Mycoplasma] cavipharyngis TaxID=92757 RepID=UPI003703F1FF